MAWYQVVLIVLAGAGGLMAFVYLTGVLIGFKKLRNDGFDSAPGWVITCGKCGKWRPASEAGITRVAAAGEKTILGRCACSGMVKMRLSKGPGEPDRRQIDERSNREIWPEVWPAGGLENSTDETFFEPPTRARAASTR